MKVIIAKNYEQLSQRAYEVLKQVIEKGNGKAVLGLATGSSPIGLYKEMIKDCKAGKVSYKNIQTVNLDEYMGIDSKNDQSYVYFMNENLFNGLDIDKNNTNFPIGKSADMQKECLRYNGVLNTLVQDIQVLGIGSNGHIGFNEPGTSFDSVTHIVELEEGTRQDNARFFASIDEVPTHAITMGVSNILASKLILVVANGLSKADAVKAMVEGEIDENCPASVLQKHSNVVVVIDEDAASKLSK